MKKTYNLNQIQNVENAYWIFCDPMKNFIRKVNYKFVYCIICMLLFSLPGDCDPGYYISGSSCLPCGFGQYQPNRHQKMCLNCLTNQNTSTIASTSQSDCQSKTLIVISPFKYHYLYLMEVRVWCYVGCPKNTRSQNEILPETL